MNGVKSHEAADDLCIGICIKYAGRFDIHDCEVVRMKASSDCLKLIRQFEGCRLIAYKATAKEKYYTIGIGHYGADVYKGMTITVDDAEDLFYQDIKKFESAVNRLKLDLLQCQFDALVSFTFNCGTANLKQLVKNRSIDEIGEAILLYNKAGGKVLEGLKRRRKAEHDLFFSNALYQVAKDVIAGKYGNGSARKIALFRAGYDHNKVQTIVNKILRGN